MSMHRIFVINYKQYPQAFGETGLKIALAADHVAEDTGLRVILAVPATMIRLLAEAVDIEVIAQHVDPRGYGANTGYIVPEAVKEAGGKGSLVNHSERPVLLSEAEAIINRLRENKLYSIACGGSPTITGAMAVLGADMVAMEPPELIGTGISVSRAKPEVITETIELVRSKLGYSLPILVGAGVSGKDDALKAVELGADGVLVASAVMKAGDPERKMREIAEGLLKR